MSKPAEDYQSLCDLARCGRELWGLETVVMTQGPKAKPGHIEDMASRPSISLKS